MGNPSYRCVPETLDAWDVDFLEVPKAVLSIRGQLNGFSMCSPHWLMVPNEGDVQ